MSFARVLVIITVVISLVGCAVHRGPRFHRGFHGHARGGQVLGALAIGALIGHAATEAARNDNRQDSRNSQPSQPDSHYYLRTIEGDCYWVQRDQQGVLRRTEVDSQYCSG